MTIPDCAYDGCRGCGRCIPTVPRAEADQLHRDLEGMRANCTRLVQQHHEKWVELQQVEARLKKTLATVREAIRKLQVCSTGGTEILDDLSEELWPDDPDRP